jgi:hypothetical protein
MDDLVGDPLVMLAPVAVQQAADRIPGLWSVDQTEHGQKRDGEDDRDRPERRGPDVEKPA